MMCSNRWFVAAVVGLVGMSCGALAADSDLMTLATNSFTAKYKGGSKSCGTNYNIVGAEPTDSGKHPVFLYMVGTIETYNNASAMAAVNGMAARGYVAASIQYPNVLFGNCSQISGKAKCIFDSSTATSAIKAVCSRPGADCDNKGIVVGGFSQGSIIATLAKNYDNRVAAAWGMGDGFVYDVIYNLKTCMASGTHALPDDRLRIANGVNDEFLSWDGGGIYNQARTITGLKTCSSGEASCYRSNGSGYHIVQQSEVGTNGSATHCYMRAGTGGCIGSENSLNPIWESGTADWNLNNELDWLYNFTAH